MKLKTLSVVLAAGFHLQGLWAQASPLGLWQTYDDKSGQAQSMVRISEAGGQLRGTIERIMDPSKAEKRCSECSGAKRDKPLVGLAVIEAVPTKPIEGLTWSGGEILDPKTGQTYRVRLHLADGGRVMEVHGYVGVPLLGRTQVWRRADQ